MPIKVSCICGNELSVADCLAGQHAKCPRCRRRVAVPHLSVSSKQKTGKNQPVETPSTQRPNPIPQSQGQILNAVMSEDRENHPTPVDLKSISNPAHHVKWFFGRGEEKRGPLSETEAFEIAKRGELLVTDIVWRKGMAQWTPAGELLEWKQYFREPEPPPEDLPPPLPAELPSSLSSQPPQPDHPTTLERTPPLGQKDEVLKSQLPDKSIGRASAEKPMSGAASQAPKHSNTKAIFGCIGIIVFIGGFWLLFKLITPGSPTWNYSSQSTDTPMESPSSNSESSSKYENMNVQQIATEIQYNLISGQGIRAEAAWRDSYLKIMSGKGTIGKMIMENSGLLDDTRGECRIALRALYVKLGGHVKSEREISLEKKQEEADAVEDKNCYSLRTYASIGEEFNKDRSKQYIVAKIIDSHTILVRSLIEVERGDPRMFVISGVRTRGVISFSAWILWNDQEESRFHISGKRIVPAWNDTKEFDVYTFNGR